MSANKLLVACPLVLALALSPQIGFASQSADGVDAGSASTGMQIQNDQTQEVVIGHTKSRVAGRQGNAEWRFYPSTGVLNLCLRHINEKTNKLTNDYYVNFVESIKAVDEAAGSDIVGQVTTVTFDPENTEDPALATTKFYESFDGLLSSFPNLKTVIVPSTVLEITDELVIFEKYSAQLVFAERDTKLPLPAGYWRDTTTYTVADLTPFDVTVIPSTQVFQNSNITKIIFPEGLTGIDNYGFNGMKKLTEMPIPEGVTTIGSYIFQSCSNLERVDIPSTVETLSGSMFNTDRNQTCVTKVYVHGASPLSESVADGLTKSKEVDGHECSILVEQQFDANYKGADAIDEQWVEWGTAIDSGAVPTPTREGYNFAGWYADPECTVAYDFSAAMAHGAVAYAKWEEQRTVTVSFETNGGTAVESQTVDEGGTIAKPATDPVREGFRFTGWYADAACNTPFDFTQAINQDTTTVYAGWVAQRTLAFDTDGGNTIASATYDDGIAPAKPADPVREGYTFKGWYDDAACTQEFDFSKAMTQDATAYAKWEKNAEPQDPKQDPQDPQQGSGQQDNQQQTNNQNNQQSGNAAQQPSANGSTAQATAQTGDPLTGAVPVVASISALAAAAAAFARKRLACR